MSEHITASAAALLELSRTYQGISHRVSGLSALVSAAPERASVSGCLPGSLLASAIEKASGAWASSLSSAAHAIEGLAFAADSLADATTAHQQEQSRGFGDVLGSQAGSPR
ncbi:hypothetical protein [Corynebacterium lactis]|uniref:ESX-1 secretion-associated protein n=1 Tax=Corynebacterium lactis RW2-5 TaxID=1408189 RepID=A0A0K2H3V4_9CORY|nr:hypothetical protein [Corynebacterium lactis]ALA68712.1 hypothetical protein CLAC_11270 [Corynebacterium lactis RW2-5]